MDHRPFRPYHGKKPGTLFFVFGALILIASAVMYVAAPFNLQKFAAFPAIFGAFFILFGVAAQLGGACGKIMMWILAALLALLVLLFFALEVFIFAGDKDELPAGEPDAVVVLGAQVHPWGPSVLLADRLNTAYDYLVEHPDVPVIVSGGQGPDEHATEAAVMRDYLVAKGLSPDRIWLEEESHNTKENLIYTRALLEKKGIDPDAAQLLVVSNGFHLSRVRMLAERQGLNAFTLAAPSTHFAAKVQSYIREAPALVKSWIFDR